MALVLVGVLALVGGGTALAGKGKPRSAHTLRAAGVSVARGMHGPGDDLAAAATYLGTTTDNLLTQLRSGKTLAQVADATSGKSASGLVAALVAHEQTEIAAAVTAGMLTQAQADQITANLTERFTDLVNGTHPDHGFGPGRPHGPGDDLAAAATYLGTTTDNLVTQLQSGKTLAQVANATNGKSASGLVAALVAHEQTEIAAAVTAGKLTQAQADQITADLTQRFTDLVNGVRPAGPPFAGPRGFHHPLFRGSNA
jgi:F0F1-type ATP synthase delta subunit